MSSFVTIHHIDEGESRDQLLGLSFSDFYCTGIEEVNLCEQEIEDVWPGETGPFVLHQVSPSEEQKLLSSNQPVKFYFDHDDHAQKFYEFALTNGHVVDVIQKIENQDWNEEWRRHYSPIVVTEKLRIVPSWEENVLDSDIVIYPGQGFGTGSHETTFLCLTILMSISKELQQSENKRILDFGCGSGILGIAASKIFPDWDVTYCDIDQSALENTLQNIQLNNLSQDNIVSRDNFQPSKFDLVFANILMSALQEEYETIKACTNTGSCIILSGLLASQVDPIVTLYSESFILVDTQYRRDWAALLMQKK